jgi:hypothetical protein
MRAPLPLVATGLKHLGFTGYFRKSSHFSWSKGVSPSWRPRTGNPPWLPCRYLTPNVNRYLVEA